MGDNGSGKSTFLRCLLGLLKPSEGHVEVMGADTCRTPVSKLARQVGFVFQNPDHQLFADSVWAEAAFAPRNFEGLDGGSPDGKAEADARIQDLLERCGLGDRLDAHPYRLSYGQKRRLNLISVLSYCPRLILLDEILIGQDPANASFLLDLLREHAEQGGAVVMVNHAPRTTRRYANRVVFFNSGGIVVDAPTEEAFNRLRETGWETYVA
jgi:energy-coupling factor transporter ATP-binding protein EcfA2